MWHRNMVGGCCWSPTCPCTLVGLPPPVPTWHVSCSRTECRLAGRMRERCPARRDRWCEGLRWGKEPEGVANMAEQWNGREPRRDPGEPLPEQAPGRERR